MKTTKSIVLILLSVLALSAVSLAGGKLAIQPGQGILPSTSPGNVMTLNGLCSETVCQLKWYVLLSSSEVGSIDIRSGPYTHFTAGPLPGTAIVIVQDEVGHMQFAKITVVEVKK
jgi:hypothetical protein